MAFVDMAGFTALTEAHGDLEAVTLVDRFEELLAHHLPPEGRLVKVVGDAGLLVFSDAQWAVTGVVQIVRDAANLHQFPELRAGIHHGPITWRRGDPYGATVNVASRIAGAAAGSQILISGEVADRLPLHVANPVGRRRFHNVSEEMELFEIPSGATDSDIDPVCQMRLSSEQAVATIRHDDKLWHLCSLACAQRFVANPAVYVEQAARPPRPPGTQPDGAATNARRDRTRPNRRP